MCHFHVINTDTLEEEVGLSPCPALHVKRGPLYALVTAQNVLIRIINSLPAENCI